MIRTLAASVLLVFAVASSSARPQDDQLPTVLRADSQIEFHATSTFTKVVGVFHSWDAKLKMPGDKFERASIEMEIEAESIEAGGGLKDKEAKGKNFFDVKVFPEIRFVSTSITADPDPSKFHMDADLTLRGVTHPVSVTIIIHPKENGHLHIDGEFSFNRRDFGMTHNAPLNKVANTVQVKFHLHVVNAPAPVAQTQSHLDQKRPRICARF